MAPDRGRSAQGSSSYSAVPSRPDLDDNGIRDRSASTQSLRSNSNQSAQQDNLLPSNAHRPSQSSTALKLAARADDDTNFTVRGVLVGLAIGIIIAFSNTYFGLQTGWVSGMAMPSALLGFAWFKAIRGMLKVPFTPVENVLVQSVAGSVGTMPLGCGFVAVIPALEYMLTEEENGPLHLSLTKLIVFAVGICFFGVVFAVPLRRQVIIREKLKFPSGTATALMIGVLHGEKGEASLVKQNSKKDDDEVDGDDQADGQDLDRGISGASAISGDYGGAALLGGGVSEEEQGSRDVRDDWHSKIRLLLWSFGGSGLYTLLTYFIPQIRSIPIFGLHLANEWLWTLNPSPAYVAQGIIMGPSTTLHMLLGAILGWGILSPLAKREGWAPGPVEDWETGSKGWIVWVSLAIMLADSLVSLGWLLARPIKEHGAEWFHDARDLIHHNSWNDILTLKARPNRGYQALGMANGDSPRLKYKSRKSADEEPEVDAPSEHLISNRTVSVGLVISLALSVGAVHYAFAGLIPLYLTLIALVFALLLSIMGVRALGETDLNPVSGISKLTQLIFAVIVPASNKNKIIINLIAGALSESGALQAGDLMQDLKAGHLLGAAPNAQFWGQMIGSAVGAVVSAVVYKLYTRVYQIPGGLFQVPTGYVWIFTARLVTGQGLPPMVAEWALGAGAVFAAATALRIWGNSRKSGWTAWIPGGIAVAVGKFSSFK